jgi:plasmid stability protein
MPSNVFSTMAARAKSHHDSLNAAYRATYSPGSSSTSTPTTSRNASTTSASAPAPQSERNITKAWKAVKKHHQEMNAAYAVFYAPGSVSSTPNSSRTSSAAPTPKASFEAQREQELAPRNYEKVWKAIKNRAVEHHRSVESASAARYC